MVSSPPPCPSTKPHSKQTDRFPPPKVVLCTLALFLSGYAIQQRTLRDLRAAIKPRPSKPSPKAHLPDRFQVQTTELEDGTIVMIESEAEREARELLQQAELKIDIKPTVAEPETQEEHKQTPEDKAEIVEQLKAQVRQTATDSDSEQSGPPVDGQKPISRAERRRLIKEEIRKLAQSDKPMYYQRRLW